MLKDLETMAGLKINKDKSKIFFSKSCNNKEEIKATIGVLKVLFLLSILGCHCHLSI